MVPTLSERLRCSLHNAESKIDHHPHFLGSEVLRDNASGCIPEETVYFEYCV